MRWARTVFCSALVLCLMAGLCWAQGGGGGGGGGGKWGKKWKKGKDDDPPPPPPPSNPPPANPPANPPAAGSPPPSNPPPAVPDADDDAKKKTPPPEAPKVDWKGSLQDAAGVDGKYILIYVHAPSDMMEPTGFRSPDVIKALEDKFVCIKVMYLKDSEEFASLGVKSTPVLLGCDQYRNEFKRVAGRPTVEDIRYVIKSLDESVTRYQKQLKEDWQKAQDWLAGKENDKALAKLVSIVSVDRRGYPELGLASDKLRSVVDSTLSDSDRLLNEIGTEKQGIATLESMVRTCRGLDAASQAKLKLFRHYAAKPDVPKAIECYKQVDPKSDASIRDAVDIAYKDLLERGTASIREELTVCTSVDSAKTRVKKIQADYEGTEVSRQAAEVLKDLSR